MNLNFPGRKPGARYAREGNTIWTMREVRRKAGRPTLKSAPITERMTIAKMEMTMLLN